MKSVCALLSVLILSSVLPQSAFAIKRVETVTLSCDTIQSIIAQEGAVILRYPSTRVKNYTLYDRYVADDRFCDIRETVERRSVPARDTNRCRVLICTDRKPIISPLFID